MLDALIARAEAVGDEVNAFTWERFERAREDARAAEARYASDAAAARPLEGMSVAIKDEMPIAGPAVTYASLGHSTNTSRTTTAPLGRRGPGGGRIVHGRTPMPEFA